MKPTSPEDYLPEAALSGYEAREGWNVWVGAREQDEATGWIVHIPEQSRLGGVPWKAWGKAEAAIAKKYPGGARELLSAVFYCEDPDEVQVFVSTRVLKVAYGAIIERRGQQ